MYHKCYSETIWRVSMQSLLNKSEDHITSTHMHKLEASFCRTICNQGKSRRLHHTVHMRRCAVCQGLLQVKNIKKEKDDKWTTQQESQHSSLFPGQVGTFWKGDSSDRWKQSMLEIKKKKAEFRVSFCSYLEIGLLLFSKPLGEHRRSSRSPTHAHIIHFSVKQNSSFVLYTR